MIRTGAERDHRRVRCSQRDKSSGLDSGDGTKLVHGQVKWLFEMAVGDWDIAIRRENNLERVCIRGGNGLEGSNDGRGREHCSIVD